MSDEGSCYDGLGGEDDGLGGEDDGLGGEDYGLGDDDYGHGNDDHAIAWGQHFEQVLLMAFAFVRDGRGEPIDFPSLRPQLDYYPPEWKHFQSIHIMPIYRVYQPHTTGMVSELTLKQRFDMVAPLVENVISSLGELKQLEFMKEEIEGDLNTYLRWYEGMANGRSFNEAFFGKPILFPRKCSEMARRA